MTESQKKAVSIVGYPKSGNTWLVRLLSDVLNSSPEGENQTDPAFRNYYNRNGEYVVWKSHAGQRSKLICKEGPILYILRDVRDVLVSSFFHHYDIEQSLVYIDSPTRWKIRSWFWREVVFQTETYKSIKEGFSYIAGGKTAVQFGYGFCRFGLKHLLKEKARTFNWSQHVDYWSSQKSGVAVVRYEDLLDKPSLHLVNALESLGIEYDAERLEEAVQKNTFARQKEKFLKSGDLFSARYMRSGRSGNWVKFLDDRMIETIRETHGNSMERLGYDT